MAEWLTTEKKQQQVTPTMVTMVAPADSNHGDHGDPSWRSPKGQSVTDN